MVNSVARSRVSNGNTLFLTRVDGRSLAARRFRDVYVNIISDLGGADSLSEAQRQMARRCAALSVEAELMEASSAAGGEIDLDRHIRLTNALGRAFARIGLQRRQRDVTPGEDLDDYLEREYG